MAELIDRQQEKPSVILLIRPNYLDGCYPIVDSNQPDVLEIGEFLNLGRAYEGKTIRNRSYHLEKVSREG
jgi:hypothetical protein